MPDSARKKLPRRPSAPSNRPSTCTWPPRAVPKPADVAGVGEGMLAAPAFGLVVDVPARA